MRVKTRPPEFLFPVETDSWLTLLRLGLGLEVTLYAFSLRTDWAYLFSGTARKVAEALLSLQGDFIPNLGRHDAASPKRPYSFWHGLVCLFLVAPCLSELAAASLRSQPGFYTCVRRKALGSSPTAWIIL